MHVSFLVRSGLGLEIESHGQCILTISDVGMRVRRQVSQRSRLSGMRTSDARLFPFVCRIIAFFGIVHPSAAFRHGILIT